MRHLRTEEWKRFCEADEAWHAELERYFGDQASYEAFYGNPETHPEDIQKAYKNRDAARIEAEKLVKFLHDDDKS